MFREEKINDLQTIAFRIRGPRTHKVGKSYDEQFLQGTFTTEHAASSYGIPVAIINGIALGCDELAALIGAHYDLQISFPGAQRMSVAEIRRWNDLLIQSGYINA